MTNRMLIVLHHAKDDFEAGVELVARGTGLWVTVDDENYPWNHEIAGPLTFSNWIDTFSGWGYAVKHLTKL